MPHSTQKPILVFLSYAAEDIDEARTTLARLRSSGLWVDNFADGQPVPRYHQQAVEIHLNDTFSLDVFWRRSRKALEAPYDPVFQQWMEHAKIVLNRLSAKYPAPRFFYASGIPMNFSEGNSTRRTPALAHAGRPANSTSAERAVANLDIELSIEIFSALLTDDVLGDQGHRHVVSQGPTAVGAKALLAQEFPTICERLRERLGADRFRLWLGALRFEDFDGECLQLSAPNAFLRNAVTTYIDDILLSSRQSHPNVRRVEILLRKSRPAAKAKQPTPRAQQKANVSKPRPAALRRNDRGLSNWQRATVKSISRGRSSAVLVGGDVPSNIFVDGETLARCGLLVLRRGQTLQVRWREADGRRIAVELRSSS